MSRLGSVWTSPPCAVPRRRVCQLGRRSRRDGVEDNVNELKGTHPQHQSIQPHQQIRPRSPPSSPACGGVQQALRYCR